MASKADFMQSLQGQSILYDTSDRLISLALAPEDLRLRPGLEVLLFPPPASYSPPPAPPTLVSFSSLASIFAFSKNMGVNEKQGQWSPLISGAGLKPGSPPQLVSLFFWPLVPPCLLSSTRFLKHLKSNSNTKVACVVHWSTYNCIITVALVTGCNSLKNLKRNTMSLIFEIEQNFTELLF